MKITRKELINMAGLGFGNVKGSGSKEKAEQYKFADGDNSVRLFGNILPRYVYWVRGSNDRNMPVECLAFNRESEEFDNAEKDWVPEYFPDLKCGWSYSMMCIANGKPQVFNFKKKLFGQIMDNVPDLGNPTDPEDGWILHFTKRKTGPLPINVEYTLQTVKCLKSKGPLTDEEKAIIAEAKTIEEIIPRPSADKQKEFLEKLIKGDDENIDESIEEELAAE